MNKNKNCAPSVCLAIALPLATLHAQQTADPAESRFQRLDTNADGLLSKEEWAQSKSARKDPKRAKKRFARMDQNSDGQISKDEFLAPKTEETAPDQGGSEE
jgi:Ca2+-binding EF-hand superfamily protein